MTNVQQSPGFQSSLDSDAAFLPSDYQMVSASGEETRGDEEMDPDVIIEV
jgi:hypothetical protein